MTTGLLNLDYYRDPSGSDSCRLTPQHAAVYYGAFIGPSCLMLAINTIVFLLVVRVIVHQGSRSRSIGKVSSCAGSGQQVTMVQIRGAVTVMALLGVTWVSGTLALGPMRLILQYVFCICNSLQGFVIFVVRVVQFPEARNAWSALWSRSKLSADSSAAARNSSGGPTTQHSSGHSHVRHTVSGSSATAAAGAAVLHKEKMECNDRAPSEAPAKGVEGSFRKSLPLGNLRRIFARLTMQGSILNAKDSHTLLERNASVATNTEIPDKDLSGQLVRPNFIIGEEISVRRSSLVPQAATHDLSTQRSLLAKEGADTSWTFLKPKQRSRIADDPCYQPGWGSVQILSADRRDRHHLNVTAVNRPYSCSLIVKDSRSRPAIPSLQVSRGEWTSGWNPWNGHRRSLSLGEQGVIGSSRLSLPVGGAGSIGSAANCVVLAGQRVAISRSPSLAGDQFHS